MKKKKLIGFIGILTVLILIILFIGYTPKQSEPNYTLNNALRDIKVDHNLVSNEFILRTSSFGIEYIALGPLKQGGETIIIDGTVILLQKFDKLGYWYNFKISSYDVLKFNGVKVYSAESGSRISYRWIQDGFIVNLEFQKDKKPIVDEIVGGFILKNQK